MAWGFRLITPKGRKLLKAINSCACDFHSSGKPTYWPTDSENIPDLIDCYIKKGISTNYLEIENVNDLSSDQVPILMMLSSKVIHT